jgi:hypothetical protein
VTTILPPDFSQAEFAAFPDAQFAAAPSDGVLPDGFFSTTNLPTFVRLKGKWVAPREPRMDAGIVLDRDGTLWVREGRRLKQGDMIAIGDKEDGSQGIFVQTHLVPQGADPDAFTFMSSEVSREKPIDYAQMARVLIDEKERGGYPIWVTGPALVHSRARADMSWFIANGYVGALLAGNAVAVHDIEASMARRSACRAPVRSRRADTACTCGRSIAFAPPARSPTPSRRGSSPTASCIRASRTTSRSC